MPTISVFYGIQIKMYFSQVEHNPPHFHAYYGSEEAAFDIRTLELLDGDLPIRAKGLVREWASGHQEELLAIWETQQFTSIPPLG